MSVGTARAAAQAHAQPLRAHMHCAWPRAQALERNTVATHVVFEMTRPDMTHHRVNLVEAARAQQKQQQLGAKAPSKKKKKKKKWKMDAAKEEL